MTVLELSVLSQSMSRVALSDNHRAVLRLLVNEYTPEMINEHFLGDRSTVLHLAALLQMDETLDFLIESGGDPLVQNGRGLNAFEVLQAMQQEQTELQHCYLEQEIDGTNLNCQQSLHHRLVEETDEQGRQSDTDCPGLYQDLTYCQWVGRSAVPLTQRRSILKNREDRQRGPESVLMDQVTAYDAYDSYIADLNIQVSDAPCTELLKSVRWRSVKSVRVYHRHINPEDEQELDDGESITFEQFEDTMESVPEPTTITSGRTISALKHPSSRNNVHGPLRDRQNYSNSSCNQGTLITPPSSPTCTRSLPPIPDIIQEARTTWASRLHETQISILPPQLVMPRDTLGPPQSVEQHAATKLPSLLTRRLSRMSFPMPAFFASEPQLTVSGSLTAQSPIGRIPSPPNLDMPVWTSKIFRNGGSPTVSRMTDNDSIGRRLRVKDFTDTPAVVRPQAIPRAELMYSAPTTSKGSKISVQGYENISPFFNIGSSSDRRTIAGDISTWKDKLSLPSWTLSSLLLECQPSYLVTGGPMSRPGFSAAANSLTFPGAKTSAKRSIPGADSFMWMSADEKVLPQKRERQQQILLTEADGKGAHAISPPSPAYAPATKRSPQFHLTSFATLFARDSENANKTGINQPLHRVQASALDHKSSTFSSKTSQWKRRKEVMMVKKLVEDDFTALLSAGRNTNQMTVELDAKNAQISDTCIIINQSSDSQFSASNASGDKKRIQLPAAGDAEPVSRRVAPLNHGATCAVLRFDTQDECEDTEHIHGITHTTASMILHQDTSNDGENEQSAETISFLTAALIDIHGIVNDLQAQRYTVRRSKTTEKFAAYRSKCTGSEMIGSSSFSPRAISKTSAWTHAAYVGLQRQTLSTCPSPSSTNTGLVYLRIKYVEEFTLPAPEQETLVSIRIDTGREKIDTDYMPWKDANILFNQEFCLPVHDNMSLTLTMHLMQAPHLLPRSTPLPHQEPNECSKEIVLEGLHRHSLPPPQNGKFSSHLAGTSTLSLKSIVATPSRGKKLLLASLFGKRVHDGGYEASSGNESAFMPGCESDLNSGMDTGYSSSTLLAQSGLESGSETISSSANPWASQSFSLLGAEFPSTSTDSASVTSFSSSSGECAQTTLQKWKRGIMSLRRKQPTWGHKLAHQRQHVYLRQDRLKQAKGVMTISEIERMKSFQSRYWSKGFRTLASSLQLTAVQDEVNSVDNGSQFTLNNPPTRGAIPTSTHCDHKVELIPTLASSRLTMAQIQQRELPLQVLSRHILFDDELCVARSGIEFHAIQSSCQNRIASVEFQTTNNWVDLNDYSGRDPGSVRQKCSTIHNKGESHGHSACEQEQRLEQAQEKPIMDSAIISRILTSMCFIPGPEMDPEDAIFEEDNHIPTEPQNLVECQIGIRYFRWHSRITYQGRLFYLTNRGFWKEAWFYIKGAQLWQCQGPLSSASPTLTLESNNIRCLELESVQSIETNAGVLKATAQYLDELEHASDNFSWGNLEAGNGADCEEWEPFYPVQHGFRLRMRLPNIVSSNHHGAVNTVGALAVTQEFHAESQDMAHAWIAALITSCRQRPPRPYWLHETE
ncbi:hypothetical protein EDD11_002966 [Mortierella claussenii]|nr:hypothetical protein EDD11_002966 [Mortierella claussenii]